MGKINDWLGIVTNIGVIAGLILVAYQISQTNDALELDRTVWDTTYRWDRLGAFQELFLRITEDEELSEVWRKGQAGESLTAEEHYRYGLLINAFFWLQWNSHRNELSRSGELDDLYDPDGVLRSMLRTMKQNPGMRSELERWLNENDLNLFRSDLERVEREMEPA